LNPDIFREVRGHRTLLSALSRSVREDRVASALLFHGPSGVGKLTTAVALCRALLCEGAGGDACGHCDACRRISSTALVHPDVGILRPQPRRRKKDGDTEDEGGEAEADEAEDSPEDRPAGPLDLQDLQEEVRQNPRWQILAGATRRRLGELFLSPGGGRRRLLLILAAERLGRVSGNILLKVLEEPPGSAVIILLCESPSALLPTIRSRCQSCRFPPLSREVVEDFLRRQGVEAGEAKLTASLAGGRIGRALLLAREAGAYRARREILSRLLSEVRRERSAAVSMAAAREVISEESGSSEDLSILMDILRDAMLSDAGCAASLLTDARTESAGRAAGITALEAASLLVRVEKARDDLRRSVNRQVAVETLFLDLADPPALPPDRD
jgi:DNA polymerase-3 subunit delta'